MSVTHVQAIKEKGSCVRVPGARKNTGTKVLSTRSLGYYYFGTVPRGGMGMALEHQGGGADVAKL